MTRTTWAVQERTGDRWTTIGSGLRLSQAHRQWRAMHLDGHDVRILLNGRPVRMTSDDGQLDLGLEES